MRPDEAATFVSYRSDPATSQWLGSAQPPTLEEAAASISTMADRGAPTPGEWLRLAIDVDGELAGDVAINLSAHGGSAEIGYVIRPEFRGRGVATEAAGLAVDRLIADHGVVRLRASLAPTNWASMRVLESIGMQFEVLARLAYRLDDGWEDDLRYAMTCDDRAAWLARPTGRPEQVALVEIDHENVDGWRKVGVHHSQRRFVSSVDDSFADALFSEPYQGVAPVPWIRGIAADDVQAGFAMVSLTNGTDGGWYLWRFLVDRVHQRRGIGERAMALIIDEARRAGVGLVSTSYVAERGGPEPFYERLGFERTGRVVEGEIEAVLRL
jgi:RimJ/RimL family protein N-acetyltransferase